MKWYKESLPVNTNGKALYPVTSEVEGIIRRLGVQEGSCTLFIQHTSASLTISESYDPTARIDMENFLNRLVPENQAWYRHTLEGADDSPSHIRSMLTESSLVIPIDDGKLNLGTWQGIYLIEHRNYPHNRSILVRILSTTE